MRIKPKGRKIYRRKDQVAHRKQVRHSVGSVIMTFVLAGVVGFVGYSVGEPVLSFLQQRKLLAPPGAYADRAERQTAESGQTQQNDTDAGLETNPGMIQETGSNETNAENPDATEAPSTPTEEVQIGFVQKAPDMQGYELPVSALMTASALQQALETLPDGISHVLVPIKIKGGNIYYATTVEEAVSSNAVQAVLPLASIYQIINQKGYEPVAVVNTLEDDIYVENYPAASYHMQDTGEVWGDKSAPQVKYWLSPENSLTQDYLAAIAEEAELAGFQILICDGLQFPNFPRSDLQNLEDICSRDDRYAALAELLTAMRANAPEIAFFVRINGADALNGDLETMHAAEALPADCLLVRTDAETIRQAEALQSLSTAVPVILEWQGDGMPEELKAGSYILCP